MEKAVYQRIKSILDEKSISVNALSKQINVAQATLNPQLRGDRTLAANIVEKVLVAFPDVSTEWVMRGEGEMYLSKSYSLVSPSRMKDEPMLATDQVQVASESVWKAKYEELEKRYDQLLSILGDGMRQSKVNVG